MRVPFRLLVTALLLPLAAGCAVSEPPPAVAVAPEPPPPLPQPMRPVVTVFPPAALPIAEAERLLADDPMALRFLALRRLGEDGLAPLDELSPRKDTNMGALLPLTAPVPPATGLGRPIPALDQLAARFRDLAGPNPGNERGSDQTRAAERTFMLDAVLPKEPATRQALTPPDQQSARKVLDRLGKLGRAGLIGPAEQAAETAALTALMASLPETLTPPPPEPVKKKSSGGSGRVSRLPGGVSGKLEVVPSPPGVAAPKVAAGFAGPVGLHLLSMGAAGHGDKAWEAMKKEFPQLAALSFKVARADLGELGATYRLIAGPLDNAAAEAMCAGIRAKGQTCQPTPFPQ